ncbi:uncharacterized protein Z520_11119 [Fonsecaea multimorphosa CBS 102226]|uniref:RRM domain-containing protein n=1 Tax=Fonsecaea multimorphosa CBS 102226 TaxID=1442371 RepID=A0A0D2KA37_9EURO|nr:uncharacterized protein Z520_11119 [Fonsecaea multimorphosa CBS 102226]KIX93263.1 hypothetical protein Z520_11119 [Fonsecaea multimorphosa CBS 102226]OAL18493.1 hypothetical protein AYO22_10689 [Fonsecaea multimorphosa]
MANSSPYDDPANINRFLQVISGNSQSAKTEARSNMPVSKLNAQSPIFSPKVTVVTDGQVENDPFKTSNGARGVESLHGQAPVLAPFHSPFPQASFTQKTAPVDLVQDQNGVVTKPAIPAAEEVPSQKNANAISPTKKRPLTPTQHRLLVGKKPGVEHLTEDKLAELSRQTQGYMDNVIDQFRKSKEQTSAQEHVTSGRVPQSRFQTTAFTFVCSSLPTDGDHEANGDMPNVDGTPVKSATSESKDDAPTESSDQQEHWQHKSADSASCHTRVVDPAFNKDDQQRWNDYSEKVNDSPEIVPFPSLTEGPIAQTSGSVNGSGEGWQASTAVAAVKDKPLSTSTPILYSHSTLKKEDREDEAVPPAGKATENDTPLSSTHSPTIVVTASTDTDGSVEEDDDDDDDDVEEENRENLVRFKSWGAPAARNKPRSRPRTVILAGLPRGADFTLVQSLIHGGAIESMGLIASKPEHITIAAHVTFTSADACDRYSQEYVKGIELRYQGKKWSIFVHKQEQVDVISGKLQGYLDCGATRVVKVNNVDDDWGIVALNKLAEGKTGTRQVEAVQDTYRNGIRTIVFRFANISHAVQFKSFLIRDDDWYGCHVEFAEDPCEKATGIRND